MIFYLPFIATKTYYTKVVYLISARGLRASLGIACERGAFSSDISVKVTAGLFTRSNCDVVASW